MGGKAKRLWQKATALTPFETVAGERRSPDVRSTKYASTAQLSFQAGRSPVRLFAVFFLTGFRPCTRYSNRR